MTVPFKAGTSQGVQSSMCRWTRRATSASALSPTQGASKEAQAVSLSMWVLKGRELFLGVRSSLTSHRLFIPGSQSGPAHSAVNGRVV